MNIILWIQSPNSPYFSRAINVLAHQYGNLNFLGIVQSDTPPPIVFNASDKSLPIINKSNLSSLNYDVIVVIGGAVSFESIGKGASLVPILNEAKKLKINPDKIILDRTICIPGFSMERYKKLRNSKLSILSINCWGGLIYHQFGLPFLSPTINLSTSEEGFLKFINDPLNYMNKELRFYKMNHVENGKRHFPSFFLGDVLLNMIHYLDDDSISIARQKWEERRLKINWYNLLVMTYTEDVTTLEMFDKLPYSKKVCFVPFKTNLDSGFYLDETLTVNPNEHFIEHVLDTARHRLYCYDLWDLLLYGKKTPLQVINN